MGIRFFCPNGHKLNVKTFLAGKRGICPDCGAKFQIPLESGGQVEAVVEKPKRAASVSSTASVAFAEREVDSNPPHDASPPASEPTKSILDDLNAQWYVRPPSGGQFGPAPSEVFRQWVKENRVSADSYIWRDSWAEWKLASVACPELFNESRVGDVLANKIGTSDNLAKSSAFSTETSSRYLAKKKSKERTFWISIALLSIIVLLASVLLFLMNR